MDQQQEALWMRAGLQADLGPIGVDKLRQICAAFKPTTGLGVDGWHHRHWSWLSNQALETLECMFRLSEAKGRWPSTAWATLLFLAPKQDGGGRPLGLLPTPIRVWEAARDPIVRDWERTHLTRDYDWTVQGRTGQSAVWHALLEEEAIEESPFHGATAMLDMYKCYELIAHNVMWLFAMRQGCNPALLHMALQTYVLPRIVRLGQACSDGVQSCRGIVAGSKFASRFLKALLRHPLDTMIKAWPLCGTVEYADDLSIRVRGTIRLLVRTLPPAVAWLIDYLQKVTGLKVSLTDDKGVGKCTFTATSELALAAIAEHLEPLGLQQVSRARWLGIDYAPIAARAMETRSKRLAGAFSTWKKA